MTTTVTTEGITAQDLLAACPLVPAVVLDRAEDAPPLGEATLAGGITAVEPPCAPRPGWTPSRSRRMPCPKSPSAPLPGLSFLPSGGGGRDNVAD